jgi:ribonuclease HI
MLDTSEAIALFSDGSCYTKDRTGGWAYVAVDAFDGIEFGSGQVLDCTNNQMELQAVSEGLFRLHKKYGPQYVMVHSDSKYVVDGMNDKERKRRVNHSYWEKIEEAESLHKLVIFTHVKGHDDNLYNEVADLLAKNARKK